MAREKRTVDTKAVNSATEVLTQIAELATAHLDDAKLARVVGDPTNDGLCSVQIYGDDPSTIVQVMNATPYIPAKGDDCYVYCVDNNLSPATAFIIQIKGKNGNSLQKLFTNQINEALANWTAPASSTSSTSGPSIVDTWRPIQVNGASWKNKSAGSGALNFKAGTNISFNYSGNDLTINATGGGTYTASLPLVINNNVISLNIGAGLQNSGGNLAVNDNYFGVVGSSTTTAPTFFAPIAAGAAGQILKSKGTTTVGGTTTYYGSEWVDIESLLGGPGEQQGDKYLKWVWEQGSGGFVWDTPADQNTWRPILVNSISWKTSATDSAVNFIQGTNVTLAVSSEQGHTNELTISATNTWRDIEVAGLSFKGNGTDSGTLKFSNDFYLTGGDPEVTPPAPDTISIDPDFLGDLQSVRYPSADNKIIASYTPSGGPRDLHWVDLPVDTNTWRGISVAGSPFKGNGIDTGELIFTSDFTIKDSGSSIGIDWTSAPGVVDVQTKIPGASSYTSVVDNNDIAKIDLSGYLTQHQTVTNGAPTLDWGQTSTVGSIGGTALTVTMPSDPIPALPQQASDEGKVIKYLGMGGYGWDFVAWSEITGKPTIPTITLNGSTTTTPSFYAPTGGGTSGQILLAGGPNMAPTWSSAVLSDANALYPNGQIDLGTSGASWDDAYLNTVLVGSGGVRPTTSATASTGATLGTSSYKWQNLYSYGANLTLTAVDISNSTYTSGARVAFIDHNGQLQKTAKGHLQTWLELKDLAYVSQPTSGDSKFLYYDYDGQLIWTPAVSGIRNATSGDFDTGNFELIGGTNVTVTRSTVSTSTNDIIRYTIAAPGASYTAAAPLSIDNNNQISLLYGSGLALSSSRLTVANPVPALPFADSGRKVLTALWTGAPDNYYDMSWESPVAEYATKLGTSGFALVAENSNELNFACSSLTNNRVQIGASGTGRTTPQSFVFGALATSLSQTHGSANLLASSGRFGGDLWTLSYDGMSWINVATEIYNLASGMAAAGVSGIRAGDSAPFSGGNIALIPGNDISITKRTNGSVTEFVFSLTCLIKGTKILMADGTERPIEQIQAGDEIASWDINTQQRTTAIVTSAFRTGSDCEYTTHLFDDGSYIVVYGKHSVYNKTLGYPTDISKFREGDETYNAAGEVIRYAGNMRYYVRSERVPHYDLNSSNNLYFANGILNGKNVFAKYRAMKVEYQTLPASIQAVLDQQEHANAPVIGYETDPQYFAAIASAMKERFHAMRLLEEAKKRLADTDYIVNKWTEGLITAVEWFKAKTERANWRENVNTQESALASIENKIKGIQAKFQAQDTSVKDRFEQFSALDNAALNEYRKWLSH